MRILAIEDEHSISAPSNLSEILLQEAHCVWELTKRGIVRDVWFTAEDRWAVLMLECANAAQAREHLATLPLARHGQIDFTVLELRAYDGFERLFTRACGPTPQHRPTAFEIDS